MAYGLNGSTYFWTVVDEDMSPSDLATLNIESWRVGNIILVSTHFQQLTSMDCTIKSAQLLMFMPEHASVSLHHFNYPT